VSDATRFSVRAVTFDDGTASVIHSSDVDGEYVLHADYARLKAECQGRQAENSVLAVECARLKAEVERLTKYYIDPASILRLTEDGKQEKNGFGYITKFAIEVNKDAFEKLTLTMMAYWNAAKEGKGQP